MRFSLLAIIGVLIIGAGFLLRNAPIAPPLSAAPVVQTRTAFAQESTALGPRAVNDFPFPSITARSAAVVDAATGVLLGEKDKDRVAPIASITKVMTALVFLDTNPEWYRDIIMERSDNRSGGTLFVRPGERLTIYDLFMTALVGSANNAAVALTRGSGLSLDDFVIRMNERAETMGLTATHFVEPTGLDPKDVSSAHDLVRMAWQAFRIPSLREALTAKEHIFATTNTQMRHRIATTNDLLLQRPKGYAIVAAKTGFTYEAGYTFLIEAEREGRSVIVAVLGAPTEEDRFRDADTLIRWVFEKYAW